MATISFNSPHTAAYPVSVTVARALSRSIRQDRAEKLTWRAISEKTSLTRVEAMRLAHNLDEVVEEIKAAKAAA